MIARLIPEADAEIDAAARWYQEQVKGLGEQFLDELVDSLHAIEKHPRRYAPYPRAPKDRDVRRCLLRRFPYLIIYEVRHADVLVLAVAHAKRRPNYWRDRLNGR
jgi:plasmid stabilization system protein ParE